MKKIKISNLQVQNILSAEDKLLTKTNAGVELIPWSKIIGEIQVGTRNYLLKSRTNHTNGWNVNDGTPSLINDPVFGNVVQWERVSGLGNYQKSFTVVESSSLINKSTVYIVVAKRISTEGSFAFGGWGGTSASLSAYNAIDLVDDWKLYRVVVSQKSVIGNVFGLHSVTGTWQFYAVGLMRGNVLCDWVPALED